MRPSLVAVVATIAMIVAIGFIVYSTMGLARFTGEVCITFEGRTQCRTASGTTREETIETARTMACSALASGVGPSIACGNTQPDSVRWLEE